MFICKKVRYFLYYNVWYIFKAYYIGLFYLTKEWYKRLFAKKQNVYNTESTHEPRYAVLTGGTQGIGLKVAEKFLELGISITIGALMSVENCLNFENSLRTKFPDSKVAVWPLNLKSMRSVKAFSERYIQTALPVHILVNNAGVMYVPYEETIDLFEHHMSVNYLGHCLISLMLLPRLIESGKPGACSRIINTSSSTHYVGDINFQDFHSRKHYSPVYCYLQSKLAVVLFTISLQKYLDGLKCNVTANSFHPGVVYTNLYKHVFWAPYVGPYLFKNPEEGSETVMYCALSNELEGIGGKYLEECEIAQEGSRARDVRYQDSLWRMTLKELDPWLNDAVL